MKKTLLLFLLFFLDIASIVAQDMYKVTSQSSLNVRSYASKNSSKLGMLNSGDIIEVYSIDNGWARIKYNGRTAYVSARYLEEYPLYQGQTKIEHNNGSLAYFFYEWNPKHTKAIKWLFWVLVLSGVTFLMILGLDLFFCYLYDYEPRILITNIILSLCCLYFLFNPSDSWWFVLDAKGGGWFGFFIGALIIGAAAGGVIGFISSLGDWYWGLFWISLPSIACLVIAFIQLYNQSIPLMIGYGVYMLIIIGVIFAPSASSHRLVNTSNGSEVYGDLSESGRYFKDQSSSDYYTQSSTDSRKYHRNGRSYDEYELKD
jgi:hypothetical protein